MNAPRLCAEHRVYLAGCRLCQAQARITARAYFSGPEGAERRLAKKSRERDGAGVRTDHLSRSAESKARARESWAAKKARMPIDRAGNSWNDEERAKALDRSHSAVSVAAALRRPVQEIYRLRHFDRHPRPLGQGPRGIRPPKWSASEDGLLAATSSTWSVRRQSEVLGRTEYAVRFRRSVLRRRGLIDNSDPARPCQEDA